VRWLIAVAAVVGFVLGAGLPSLTEGAPTGRTIIAQMTPPTLASGQQANLNCGWHTACVSPWSTGIALDWEDGGTGYGNPWFFRGFFAVDSSSSYIVARGAPLTVQEGSNKCDIQTVWIIEQFNGVLRAAPTYQHVSRTTSTQFYILGSLFGTYVNRQIGATVSDFGGCDFTGSHVHEYHSVISGPTTISRNTSKYPTASTCHNLACGLFTNSSLNNWTRKFTWPEGQ